MSAKSPVPPAGGANPDVFRELGHLTRRLHEDLERLGAIDHLQQSAEGLSDARSRLNYVVRKSGEAADKVLTAVDAAKLECAQAMRQARQRAGDDAFAAGVEQALSRVDEQLTHIMLAQDFHDLTSQVVSRVVALVAGLEDNLVQLLVKAAPAEQSRRAESAPLAGPVVDAAARADVVTDQAEVDALLADLGF
jgi:chemotaxis protein CheZ